MFNRSLFKQSCKANGTMWIIITVAVCFMLSCVMLIAGDDSLSTTKTSIENTIIEGELTSETETRAVNYYTLAERGLAHFDEKFIQDYNEYLKKYNSEKAYEKAYFSAQIDLISYVDELIASKNIDPSSKAAEEIKGAILMVFNPMNMFDEFYSDLHENIPTYDAHLLISGTKKEATEYRQTYAMVNSSIFLAGNMVKNENIQAVLVELEKYGVSLEQYKEFGFTDYGKIKNISTAELVNFIANYNYRLATMVEGESEESILEELKASAGESLLSNLPTEVGTALEEIGQADLYGILVGSVFFKMAGLLLPIIYLIMTANALIAGQVDSGSMAYILSSSVKRRTVTFTQAVYLIGSLFVMFLCTSVTSMICLACVNVATELNYGNILLINLGAFLVMFAMSGICFFASCWFNRSKHSMALGGGLNMFFLVATMLGLFGSSIIPSIIRMNALNMFNYVSIISLFDVISIIDGSLTYLWKFAILIVIGVIGYAVGSEKFARKDLPL